MNDSTRPQEATDDGRTDDDHHAVPHGEAPGDHAREQASVLVMRERGPPRVAVYDDARTDEWIEADADAAVEPELMTDGGTETETTRERAERAVSAYGVLLKPTGQSTGGKMLHATRECQRIQQATNIRTISHAGELPLTVGGLCSECVHLDAAEAGEIDIDATARERLMADGGSPGSFLAAADDDLVEAETASRDGDEAEAREAIRRARQRIQAAMTTDGRPDA
jgi:hypothetical protein